LTFCFAAVRETAFADVGCIEAGNDTQHPLVLLLLDLVFAFCCLLLSVGLARWAFLKSWNCYLQPDYLSRGLELELRYLRSAAEPVGLVRRQAADRGLGKCNSICRLRSLRQVLGREVWTCEASCDLRQAGCRTKPIPAISKAATNRKSESIHSTLWIKTPSALSAMKRVRCR